MNQLKNISIKARFAIGLTCAKLLLRQQGLHQDPFFRQLIDKIGKFTQYKDLSIWDDEHRYYCYSDVAEMTGKDVYQALIAIKKAKEASKDIDDWHKARYTPIEVLDEAFYDQLVEFYKSEEHQELKDIFERCGDLGSVELYGAMSKDNSKNTLEIIEKILKETNLKHEFDFDKIAEEYPFKTKSNWVSIKGWGVDFDFKTFKRS